MEPEFVLVITMRISVVDNIKPMAAIAHRTVAWQAVLRPVGLWRDPRLEHTLVQTP